MGCVAYQSDLSIRRFRFLVLHCPNVIGIVYRVSKFLFERQANITESAQYDDEDSDRFFMRVTFDLPQMTDTAETLTKDFSVIANSLDMQARFHAASERPRLLLLASQWTHCLADLLQRCSSGELNVDIVGVCLITSDKQQSWRVSTACLLSIWISKDQARLR